MAKMKVSQLPFNILSIKLTDPKNRGHINRVKDALKDRLEVSGFSVWDYRIRDIVEDFENLDQVQAILKVIFSFVISITMFLCFFSLSASMSANLYQQSKEIGVMRAIGISKAQVLRIFVYEAFILVFSSAL